MKKSLLLIFLATIVLAGCTNRLSKSELFEKKQECANLQDKIEQDITKECDRFTSANCFLGEIFYSEQYNSCMYYWYENMYDIGNRGYRVTDFFTKKTVYEDFCKKDNLECIDQKKKGVDTIIKGK